ncbi:unnamed protein product [Pleuronectes platessa]|uniref:Uncharacterized protein n=1 Tax=Pleuronectes platessa TaxID=8262 RepID=A0A9N7UHK7_PLEPL|nr:unnamed protein product [Pleuronectes platessa]
MPRHTSYSTELQAWDMAPALRGKLQEETMSSFTVPTGSLSISRRVLPGVIAPWTPIVRSRPGSRGFTQACAWVRKCGKKPVWWERNTAHAAPLRDAPLPSAAQDRSGSSPSSPLTLTSFSWGLNQSKRKAGAFFIRPEPIIMASPQGTIHLNYPPLTSAYVRRPGRKKKNVDMLRETRAPKDMNHGASWLLERGREETVLRRKEQSGAVQCSCDGNNHIRPRSPLRGDEGGMEEMWEEQE